MTDGTTKFLNGVLFVQWMVSERLRVATVTRVIDSEMAGRAPIHAVEFRKKDLVDLNWDSFGQFTLLRRRGAPDLLLDVFVLVILPLAILVSEVCEHDQTAYQ
jgi:hypothetical protein